MQDDPGEQDNGLLGIALSDSDSDKNTKDEKNEPGSRTGQSEAAFSAIKATYTPKIENGEVWKTISLPLEKNAPKKEVQEVLHAVEELYFFQRFDEALGFIGRVFENPDCLGAEMRTTLESYERRCKERADDKRSKQ